MRFIALLIFTFSTVNSARILGYFYFPSISHQFLFQSIMKQLSLRGHDVTFITPNPLKDRTLVNLTEIDVSEAYQLFKSFDFSNVGRSRVSLWNTVEMMNDFNEAIVDIQMGCQGIQELLRKPSDSYDLILIEPHFPFFFALKQKFHAPLIAVSSLDVYSYYHHMIGNPTHPVLYPDIFSEKRGPVSLIMDKIYSLYVNIIFALLSELSTFPRSDILTKKYFGEKSQPIKETIRETSLWMLNINPIFSNRKPNVPNVVQYFNIHLKRNESYSEDLQGILDNAKEGVVYFSLGTNVRLHHIQGDVKKTILEALGDLPYTVLCKWESEGVAGQTNNIYLRKWLPQQAILAHPNIKVFVTQGGLQSSEEAISNAVPLLVIPFLGDPPMNAKILTANGMAETIQPEELNRDILTQTILKVVKNNKYRNRAKDLQAIFLDQPQPGIDKVIWWCEYVIRHEGAEHLRSPAADLPLYEYFLLDILAVVLITCYIFYKMINLILKSFLGLFKKLSVDDVAPKKIN